MKLQLHTTFYIYIYKYKYVVGSCNFSVRTLFFLFYLSLSFFSCTWAQLEPSMCTSWTHPEFLNLVGPCLFERVLIFTTIKYRACDLDIYTRVSRERGLTWVVGGGADSGGSVWEDRLRGGGLGDASPGWGVAATPADTWEAGWGIRGAGKVGCIGGGSWAWTGCCTGDIDWGCMGDIIWGLMGPGRAWGGPERQTHRVSRRLKIG